MSHVTPEPFTWSGYAAYLDLAIECGYTFAGFAGIDNAVNWPTDRFVLWRHDIDYDPACIEPIRRLEAARGVRATYFFCRIALFMLESTVTLGAIESILRDGHWLGLHFDASRTAHDEVVVDQVEEVAAAWERRFGAIIPAVSFHNPGLRPVRHLELKNGRLNVYCPSMANGFEYVSESNQNWRGKNLAEVLRRRPRALQVLTHPIWWQARRAPFIEILQDLAQRLNLDLDRDILTCDHRALLATQAISG